MAREMEVILTHENTDFDALASLLGAAKLYPQAKPVVPRRPNRNLRDFLTLYWDELSTGMSCLSSSTTSCHEGASGGSFWWTLRPSPTSRA
jgi:hypothetical protein